MTTILSSKAPSVLCSICSEPIVNFLPEYFMGEKFNPACSKCKNEPPDLYSSFPVSGPPSTLMSHWIPPHYKMSTRLSLSPSFRAHYVRLSNPRDYMVIMDDFLHEVREILQQHREEQLRRANETCNQSWGGHRTSMHWFIYWIYVFL